MDKVRFVVLYGGEWSNNGGKFKYQFGMCKVISVSRETTYQSLHDIISRLVEANPSESSIKMKFIFNSPEVLAQINGFDGSFVKSYNSLSEAYKVYALYPPRWNKERVCNLVVTKTISHENKWFPYVIGSLMGVVVAIVVVFMLR